MQTQPPATPTRQIVFAVQGAGLRAVGDGLRWVGRRAAGWPAGRVWGARPQGGTHGGVGRRVAGG